MLIESGLEMLVPLASGLLSGSIVAFINFLLTKRKTRVEIAKMEAETEKIRLEISKLVSASAGVSYGLSGATERIIYDSDGRDISRDFHGKEDFIWVSYEGKFVPSGEIGRGLLSFERGEALSIQRNNKEGRFQVWLERYFIDGVEKGFVPKDDLISGQRNILVRCEAKTLDGDHSLRFVLKSEDGEGRWLASEDRRVSENAWTAITVHFRISPSEQFRLRIDDYDVSRSPSSVQIRKLNMAERIYS